MHYIYPSLLNFHQILTLVQFWVYMISYFDYFLILILNR